MMTTVTNTRWRFGSRERKKKRKAGGTKNLFLGLFLLFLPLLNHGQSCPPDSIARVMLVGDSWSQFTHLYQSYQRAFTKYGFPEVVALGDRTAIGGTRASDWLTPEYFDLVALEFSLHPEVDLVILCLGGNDLQASDGWRRSQTPAQQDSVFDRIGQRIEQVALAILQLRPDVDILLGGYDYLNFVETLLNYPAGATNPYESTWNRLEQPTVREVNLGLGQLESRKLTIAQKHSRIHYVNSLGLNHYIFGYPTPLPVAPFGSFAPRTTPLPGQAPAFSPLNGGNIDYPSPQEAMGPIVPVLNLLPGFDCIHLNSEAYFHYADQQTRHFLYDKLHDQADFRFFSQGSPADGWVSARGDTGTGQLQIGMESGNELRSAILSFDTESLPEQESIARASLFVRRDSLLGGHPLQAGSFRLDIISGSFGNTQLEASDFDAPADLTGAACLLTTAADTASVLRFELRNEALPFLNRQGLSQFRIVFEPDSQAPAGLLWLHQGDQPGFAQAPSLDIFLGNPTSMGPDPVSEGWKLFPNPAQHFFQLEGPASGAKLRLWNQQGQQVRAWKAEEGASYSLEGLPAGLYFLRIQQGEKWEVKKIVKR
jgi:lysophospholipase L1-like esterase